MITPPAADAITPQNFHFMQEVLRQDAAIVIEAGKEYLVESRLNTLAARYRFSGVNQLVDTLRLAPGTSPRLRLDSVDALTTNETYFFRDLDPFDALRDHLIPQYRQQHPGQPLHIWSAASSTGQEAYSISMLVSEHFPDLPVTILGTDLSPSVVTRARSGVFGQIEVNRGLPARLLVKYFQSQGGQWTIHPSIRARTEFREMNLATTWPYLPRAHVVFLRNVMIYFDVPTRQRILQQVKSVLAPGGYLVLGGAETTVTLDLDFKPVTLGKATFYQL